MKIAVIGAGPAGLIAGNMLAKNKQHDVVVYEKAKRVAPVADQSIINGNIYDLSTVYIPNIHWDGKGPMPEFKELLDEFGVKTIPATWWTDDNDLAQSGFYWDTRSGKNLPFTKVIEEEGYTVADMVQQSMKAVELYSSVQGIRTVQECLKLDIVEPFETHRQWADRHGISLIADLQKRVYGDFGIGDINDLPAAQVMMMGNDKHTSGLAYRLYGLMKTGYVRREQMSERCKIWMDFIEEEGVDHFLCIVEDGYRSFFDAIVRESHFQLKKNECITRLDINSESEGKIRISSSRGCEDFDKVIISSRPQDSIKFLDPGLESHKYLSQVTSNSVYQLSLVVGDGYPLPLGKSWMYPGPFGNEKNAEKDQSVVGTVYRYGDGILVVDIQTSPDIAGTKLQDEKTIQELSKMGMKNIRILESHVYPHTPSHLSVNSVAEGWYDKFEELQGKHNLYYLGELFTGHGVTNTCIGTQSMIKEFFPEMK